MVFKVEAWDRVQGAERARKLYEEAFGEAPVGVWCAPGRVNLIGEHVDYNGGPCMPIALPHATYAAVGVREDDELHLVSGQEEGLRTLNLAEVGPGKVPGWPAYVAGVIWALREAGHKTPGFNIAIDSCVPYGAGLSSSAALEGSVAVAVAELIGLNINDEAVREELVPACIRAENEIAGANTGGLDQTASLLAHEGDALFVDFLTGKREYIPFDLAAQGLVLLVTDTRAPHSLNDGQYANRRATCENAAEKLGVKFLSEIKDLPAALEVVQADGDIPVCRVRHVVTEIERTADAVKEMQAGPLEGERLQRVAALFDASHDSLRDDYEVTCPELDCVVDTVMALGSHGARMTGGGFGGSAIAIVEADKVEETMAAIEKAFAERGFNEPHFLIAVAGAPAARVI